MPEHRRALEDEIRRLAMGLAALEGRVSDLEQGEEHPAAASVSAPGTHDDEIPSPEVVLAGLSRSIQYIGRLFLVLGGAYLLRSMTEGGNVPPGVGVALGLAYGLLWISVAARAGARGNTYAASWHGIAAAAITLPLIWETSARYGIVPPSMSALMLAASALFALAVGWRYRLRVLAWLFVGGAGLCALTLLVSNPGPGAPFALALTIIGCATLWAGRQRGWLGLIFVSALCADLTLLLFVERTLTAEGSPPLLALFVPMLLFVAYTGSISLYVLRGWWRLDLIDVAQTALALALGFTGALRIAQGHPAAAVPLGLATLLLALGLYFLAFTALDRDLRRRFYYITSIALVLVLVGCASLLDAPALPWALLAVATAAVGRRFGRVSLTLHATLYITAAVLASGLGAAAFSGWIPAVTTAISPPSGVAWLTLLSLAICALLPARGTLSVGGGMRRFPHFFTLAVLICTAGGLLLEAVTASVTSPAWLATARTGAIAALALGAAALSQLPHYRSARYLVYVLLAAGALKLLVEDLPRGVPASLAVSFLVYGAMLIIAHRLARNAAQGAATRPEENPPSEA